MSKNNIGALLYAYRVEHPSEGAPMSKSEVAKQLGVSRQTLDSWTSGSTLPKFDKMLQIADLLNVSLDVLAGR